MGKYYIEPLTKAQRVKALLESLPDDIGQLPPGPIDGEEIASRETCADALHDQAESTSWIHCRNSRLPSM